MPFAVLATICAILIGIADEFHCERRTHKTVQSVLLHVTRSATKSHGASVCEVAILLWRRALLSSIHCWKLLESIPTVHSTMVIIGTDAHVAIGR